MQKHVPVLLKEVIKHLSVKPGGKYIDATLGYAGHTRAIRDAGGIVLGIDQDPDVIDTLQKSDSEKMYFVTGNFEDIGDIAVRYGFDKVDGVLFDFGMGSHQLDDSDRGFSFQKTGPLDMRYDQHKEKRKKHRAFQTAADILKDYQEKELVRVFREYGEEKRFGKRVARAIVKKRSIEPLKTTTELFELIKQALPARFRRDAGDVARRIFQALRIEVNRELEVIEKALPQAVDLLNTDGRLVVISFHSLEDRIVKNFLHQEAKDCICPPEVPVCRCDKEARLAVETKRPVTPTADEQRQNPRSKSAKLRAARKIV